MGLGLAFARSLTGITGADDVGDVRRPRRTRRMRSSTPAAAAGAWRSGVVTSMIAAYVPGAQRRARGAGAGAAKGQVPGAQRGREPLPAPGRRLGVHRGLAAVPAASREYRPLFYLGYALALLSALLLVPFLSQALVKVLRVPLKWLRPVEGALAADSLLQAPRRTSATVAALVLSLALVVGAGRDGARQHGIDRRMGAATRSIPTCSSPPPRTSRPRDFHFPAVHAAGARSGPGRGRGPAGAVGARAVSADLPLLIVAIDEAKVGKRRAAPRVAGDLATMDRLAAEGKGVIVAENLAALAKLEGRRHVRAAGARPACCACRWSGVIRDLSNQLGTVFIDRARCSPAFGDESVDIFRVYAKPGVCRRGCCAARIVERLGKQRHMFVHAERARCAKFVGDLMNQWFGMTYLQILVAVSVAVLGIVNTLTVSITDRRRELGVLRAVGGLRSQIRHTVWMEALTIGLIGLMLGLRHRRSELVLRVAGGPGGPDGHSARVPFPVRRSRAAAAGDSGRRVRVGDSAGRDGGAKLAGGGAGI